MVVNEATVEAKYQRMIIDQIKKEKMKTESIFENATRWILTV